MANPKNSKDAPATQVGFDEQLWPVNVALLVTGGFSAGCIIALSEFDNPTWYMNGSVRLAILVASIVLLIVVASRLNNRIVRRAIQLAAVLSLLVHMIMMVALYNQGSEFLAEVIREKTDNPVLQDEEQQEEVYALPDYNYNLDAPSDSKKVEDFERPVETKVPEKTKVQHVEREQTTADDHPVTNKTPIEVPDGTPTVQPTPAKQRRVEQAAPKRANTPSKLSRQTVQPAPQPQEPTEAVATTEEAPQEAESILKLDRSSTAVRQRSSASRANDTRVSSPNESLRIPERQTAKITRRQMTDPSPLPASSTPMLQRKLNEPAAAPTAGAESVQELAESKGPTSSVGSSTTSVSRQQSSPAASVAMSPSSEPRAARAPTAGPFSVQRVDNAPASDQPQVGTRPSGAPARSLASANFGGMQAVDGPGSGGSPGSSATPGIGGSASPGFGGGSPGSGGGTQGSGSGGIQIARAQSSSGMPGGQPTSLPGPGLGATGQPGGGVPGAPLQRAEQAGVPSLNPSAPTTGRASRAIASARVEGSPTSIDSPGTSPSAGDTASSPSPSTSSAGGDGGRLTLSRGTSGISGGGQSVNFGHGTVDVGPTTVGVASMSAARSRATQTGPSTGGSAGPSSNATLARGIASANVSTSTLEAADVDIPDSTGSGTVGDVETSAGSGIARSSGSAARGAVNASAGTGDIDTGPTQIVAARPGAARTPAGGGGPTIRSGTAGISRGLGTRGGGALATLGTAGIADMPEAPPGDGGGAPVATSTNTPSSAAVARNPGGGAGGPGAPGAGAGGLALGGNGPGGGSGGTGTGGLGGPRSGGAAGGGGGPRVEGALATRAGGSGSGGDGPSVAGGGSRGPSRSVGRAAVNTAEIVDDVAQLPAGPETTGGEPTGEVAAAAAPGGAKAVRGAAGLPGPVVTTNVGAAAGPTAVSSPTVGAPGVGLSERKSEEAGEPSATVGNIAASGRLRRMTVAGLPNGTPDMIDDPVLDGTPGEGGPGSGGADGEPGGIAMGKGIGGLARRTGGNNTLVQVASVAGPGGLGAELAPEVGSLSRRASRDGEVAHAGTARVANRKIAGGPVAVDGTTRDLVVGVPRYGGKQKRKSGGPGLPLERTEVAVQSGLDFLARHQSADGAWTLNNYGAGQPGYENEKSQFNSETAATGLAILAFYGAGFDHRENQYRATVRGGIDAMIRNQKASGDLYVPIDAETTKTAAQFSHAIAATALVQAYALTGDDTLRGPAQKALDFIVASQSSGSNHLGSQFGSDVSLAGWQFLALKGGELAGFSVPPSAFTELKRQVDANLTPAANKRTQTAEAISLLMRLHVGEDPASPDMVAAADALLAKTPAVGTAAQPSRDASYWYFGTQAMYLMQGKYWDGWRERLHPLLVDRQMTTGPFAGSWDPAGAVPDRFGTQAGRIYVSGVDVLTLEVHHHNLPLYEKKQQ